MKSCHFFTLFLFLISKRETIAFLNEAEYKISSELMEALGTDHKIFLEELNSKLINLRLFKSPVFWGKAATYQNTDQILKYFRKQTFPHPPTIIIYKTEKLKSVIKLLETIRKKKKKHIIAKFTWLVFVDSYDKHDENRLPIPIDSQFIIAYPINAISFKLVEIFKIQSQTTTFDFGIWDGEKLNITEVPWYRRRTNFKNETLTLGGWHSYGPISDCYRPDICVLHHYSETLSSTLNCSFKSLKFSNHLEIFANVHNWDLLEVAVLSDTVEDNTDHIDITSQLFVNPLNWYIREPIHDKAEDYYLQPFETQVWIFILVTLIIGSLIAMFVNYLMESVTRKTGERFNVKDHFFMPFDSVCNQEGARPETSVPSRIVSFTFRFQTLFLFGLYSAIVTSYSAVQFPRIPFRSVDEFLENGQYNAVYLQEFAFAFKKPTTDPRQLAIREKIIYANNYEELKNKVCTGPNAFDSIFGRLALKDIQCPLHQIEQPIYQAWLVGALSKNSPYRVIFNNFHTNFYSSGIRQIIHLKHLANPTFTREIPDFDVIGLKQTVQIFGIYVTGLLISIVIIFPGELLFSYMKIKIKKWKTRKEGKLFIKRINGQYMINNGKVDHIM